MRPGSEGYPGPVTQQDRSDGPGREPQTPLDPETAVDELEERVTGRRTAEEDEPDHDAGDDGRNPVEGDSGTGVDEESSG